ncbi:isopeptide-forming domain-containing fimbrial protein [Bifidobacterium adolescentis]|uniref:isopeptide-forming domain-containing fimbrial protein n=1 Tax=Bifidobacterium adolescentis TaxID=1680 RepID=UPI000E4F488A|nr:isopeptide-forming domain-containing fimbrial protein [Bifidobacterium adolescentis]RHC29080.1 isopeptide-forming domain-containing fimbrial protein [Bifidobacterium adolescentis]
MNKVLKGLVAVVSTAAMAIAGFAGAASATAAGTNYDITVPSTDTHTYSVYQVFTGDLSNGTLSNIKAGQNFNKNNTASKSAADAAAEIAQGTYANNTEKLAAITPYVDLTGTAFGEVSANTALSAPAGYYLLKDKDAVTGDDAATLFIVQVNGPVTVNRKADKPTFEKKVKDVNDSTGDKSDWQDSADYDVNDEVPFQLTATLPTNDTDFAAYKTYKLVFHDQQSAGLTFNEKSVVVKYGDKTLGADSYTVTENPEDKDTFDITIADAKAVKDAEGSAITVAAGGKFTVEYTSTLNENAVIGSTGNPNEASLEFSNNPNVGGEGETGKTPTDKVIVFTYQLDINKTFNGGTPAENDLPKFKLYKFDSATNDYTIDRGEVTITKTEDGKYTASFKRVDDGKYKLVETKTPAGFNTAADTLFEITADHDVESDNPQLTVLKINTTAGNTTTGTVTADVVNQKGSTLPSTGGMGTVLLYVAGIAVFVLAGATLVMALRRRNA